MVHHSGPVIFSSFRSSYRGLFREALLFISLVAAVYAQPSTNIKLPAATKGAAAIKALGEHLPAVAKAHGLDTDELTSLLATQSSLGVDMDGVLFFACEGLAVTAPSAASHSGHATPSGALTANSSVTKLALGAAVDAFQLHSLPGATRIIYLDFDGHTTSGTLWNSNYTGGAPIVSKPFDLDGSPTTFSATERAIIQGIWQRVAEDYAPFAIDVTTQDPGLEALRRTDASDLAYGIRVVISPTNWYNAQAGGVGYVGSFNWNTDTPCFAFTDQLANGEKYIAEAAAHEVGHTVGLYHDGASGSGATEYYAGQGNWAPIMGVGYYKPVTEFSKGEYPNANNTQDDFAVMSAYAPLATDDHGNTLATAHLLSGPNLSDGGTIESRNDIDVFRFDTAAGAALINVTSPSPESDLHMKVELLNSAGQALLVNDASSLNAAFNVTLPAGTYYIRVSGIGEGDANTTGYTDYGSVGNYIITGTIVSPSGKQAPVAVATASTTSGTAALSVVFSGQASADADGSIVNYQWDFGNGALSTLANPTYVYTTPGTFTAVLTVSDNDGLSSTASVTISVLAPTNRPPVAIANANIMSGPAPLAVTFSSAGSSDSDGTIVGYIWDFGDGTTSNASAPTKTYTIAGFYTARLTVTDNNGATGSASVAITVTANGSSDVDVSQFTADPIFAADKTSVSATVWVTNRLGQPVAGVSVTMQWSGLVSGSITSKTDASGKAVFVSGRSKKSGTINATITAVTPPTGVKYDPTIYTESLVRAVSF